MALINTVFEIEDIAVFVHFYHPVYERTMFASGYSITLLRKDCITVILELTFSVFLNIINVMFKI